MMTWSPPDTSETAMACSHCHGTYAAAELISRRVRGGWAYACSSECAAAYDADGAHPEPDPKESAGPARPK